MTSHPASLQSTATQQQDIPRRLQSLQNHLEFPPTEPYMAPISGQTPQQRPPLANQSHTRSSSFFSFRSKQPSESQNGAPQGTSSMLNGDTNGSGNSTGSPQHHSPSLNSVQGRGQDAPPQQQSPQQSQQVSQSAQATRSPSIKQPPVAPPPLHPEVRSVVQLTSAHAHKIYFSGPLVRRIERQPDGQRPAKDDGWSDVWAQLGGTTLSIWDMKQIQEASQQGKEVPPTYVNTTDAFVQVLGSVTVPATASAPSKRYTNVLTLNTAGSNLLLFSCPTTAALMSWAAALRLSAWEKSRLEEIYTAHLIRITLGARDLPSTLVRGRMEGWVRVRIAGQTDWKRMWMVVSAGTEGAGLAERPDSSGGGIGGVPTPVTAMPKKKRMSNLFSREHNATQSVTPTKPIMSMYASPKPKDKKKALLTMRDVTQAFAVYPERPELISRSTLIKIEGLLGDEETAAAMRSRECWLLVMPELEGTAGQAAEMLKWVVALHDAFELYGRPEAWTWDPRDPTSLMFAYPVGPNKDLLFLDRALAEALDPRDDRTFAVRSRLIGILLDRMRGNDPLAQPPRPSSDNPPSLPPIGGLTSDPQPPQNGPSPASTQGPQLPPLRFGGSSPPPQPERRPLTPITERSSVHTNGRTLSGDAPGSLNPVQDKPAPSIPDEYEVTVFNQQSPTPISSHLNTGVSQQEYQPSGKAIIRATSVGRRSFDSSNSSKNIGGQVKFDPKVSPPTNPIVTQGVNPPGIRLPAEEPTTFTSSIAENRLLPQRSASILTSPYSLPDHDHQVDSTSRTHLSDRASDRASVLTSPHSILASQSPPHDKTFRNKEPTGSVASRISGSSSPSHPVLAAPTQPHGQAQPGESNNIFHEAGPALHYMQESEPGNNHDQNQSRRLPTTIAEQYDGSSSSSNSSQPPTLGPPSPNSGNRLRSPPVRQSTPMAFVERSSSKGTSTNSVINIPADRLSPTSRPGLGRKPSGARAQSQIQNRPYNGDGILSSQPQTQEETSDDQTDTAYNRMDSSQAPSSSDDPNLDALAALSYLDADDEQHATPATVTVEPLKIRNTEHSMKAPSPPLASAESESGGQFKSSFAPSRQAAERKAKAQAQQAAHHAAVHKPGRANGKRKSRAAGTWNESSDEEEDEDEEEDDDDDDADSDAEPSIANKQVTSSGVVSSNTSIRPLQSQGQLSEPHADPSQLTHLRPPRTLPQIPGPNSPDELLPPRRLASDQYSEQGRRTYYDGTPIRTQTEFPQPGAARQSVWSQVLDPGRTPGAIPDTSNSRDTFVQLEPAEAMTKAFTPQGLLSAGIQDKQDRSAKRQEELARETGASLINVPNKPPPPQMGLLGAITAHERERKREGGVGAALTEREREKRLAEDRQRRFDDHQRQQLDQMQQGGSMYGGQYPGYNMMGNPMMMMNPMMNMNPMMTGGGLTPMMTGAGMAPMMTGGGIAPMMTGQMGYAGMMPGYNPQHMFAAQHAAQAYQQAMVALSVAGSQAGGEGGGGPPQLNPVMTGGNIAGFDPRMSMMGMPMMGMPMMGTPQMSPMGMNMTGVSGFDPRFPPNMNNSPTSMNDPGLAPPVGFGGQGQGQYSSSNSSPAGRGSPLARTVDNADRGRNTSRPTSPKP